MSSTEHEYLLVTQYFHPDTASTGELMTDLAVGLRDRGLNVNVYTTQPNYHSGELDKQPRQEEYKGVDVTRIRAPQFKQTSFVRRAFNWIVFTVWMTAVILIDTTDENREAIFVSNPPFFGLMMWGACRIRGLDYTYIVQDLWPERGVDYGFFREGGVIDRVWTRWHRRVLVDAERIVAIGQQQYAKIINYAPKRGLEEKSKIIHNWEDSEFITPVKKEDNWFSKKYGLDDVFSILYAGNIGLYHDLETPVTAVSRLEQDEAKMLIIGEGDNRDAIEALSENLGVRGDQVQFLPYLPEEDLPHALTCCDISVVTLKEGIEGTGLSSKLYTSLAAGTPVLIVAHPESDEARIVVENDCGKNVRQGNIDGVVEAIKEWKANPDVVKEQGRNARRTFDQKFTKENSIDEYYEFITKD